MERIVLAYSGGLDTSVAIPWLKERYGADIVAVTVDLGQGAELESARDRALAAGATRAHVLDVRDEFALSYLLPSLQADALYEDRYPLPTALGRPLIAQKLVEIADIERAAVVAHGCACEGIDQVQLENATKALRPDLKVIAPARDWDMTLFEKIEYLRARGVGMPATRDGVLCTEVNLWGRSIICPVLEDLSSGVPGAIDGLPTAAAHCPEEAASVEIAFDAGLPIAVNGVPMTFLDLIESLGTIAGAHGVGRFEMAARRLVGTKLREVLHAPAATVLHAAHRELQKLVVPLEVDRFARLVSAQYANLIHDGLWYTPLRDALDAFVKKVQERVTGAIRLELFNGDCRVVGRTSPNALCDHALTTFGTGNARDGGTAAGFSRILGLPTALALRKPLAPQRRTLVAE